jgi:sugar-specific transcriptional regulator TrmB
MDTRVLEQLGITNAESRTYVAMLELGSSQAAAIVAKTGLHRRTVYDAIERLVEKGLASYIKQNNIKFYNAVNPKHIMELMKQKEEQLQEIMPQLELLQKMSKEKQETTFFKGKEALKAVFNDQINDGKEIFIFVASTKAPEILKYYFPHFDSERKKRKISVTIIFDENAKKEEYVKGIPLSKIRYVPKEYSTPAATNIYGDKVSIVLWAEDPIAILIQNKEIAEGYRRYFELVWKTAKE